MSEYQYNKVTPEMIEKFKEIAPKRVLVGDEINEDFTHDEMAIYGKARPVLNPGVPASTKNIEIPLTPFVLSVIAVIQ